MNNLRWKLRVTAARLGREGMLGIGLLFLSLCVYTLVLQPTQTRINQLHAQLVTMASSKESGSGSNTAHNAPVTEQLAAYYRFFPAQLSAPKWLGEIYKDAKAQNLVLTKGKYTPLHERAGKLIRYEINLPVSGNFQQIYRFISKVLKDIPYIALNSISYERRKIGETSIKAKIKFYLYLGPGS